jgi:hypothetical protein
MKNLHKSIGLFCLTLSAPTLASYEETPFEPGWQFILSANLGYGSETSQSNTHDDNKTADFLDSNGKSISAFLPFPFIRVEYTLDSGYTQFYLGQSEDQVTSEQFQAELGVNHYQEGIGLLTAAYFPKFPGVSEVWEDPYLIGSERKTTHSNAHGGRIAYSPDTVLPLTLRYAFVTYDVDDEKSGQSQGLTSADQKKLDRNSDFQQFGVETLVPLGDSFAIMPAVRYTLRDAKGDAHSFKELSGELAFQYGYEQHSFVLQTGLAKRDFDTLNPVFDKKQDTTVTNLFGIYTYNEPFGYENFSLSVIGGVSNEDSDINFHDTNSQYIATGVIYYF